MMEPDTGLCMSQSANARYGPFQVTLPTMAASGTWIAEQVKQQVSVNERIVTARSPGVACDLQ